MSESLKYRQAVKDLSTSLLDEGKTIRIKAHGYSMYPAIRPGTILIIDPVSAGKDPAAGEIVAIKRESGIVVHRISEIVIKGGTRYYIARGDSNAWPDKPVRLGMIAGRIVRSETTAECTEPADIRINLKPSYIINRLRVISIIVFKKFRSGEYLRRLKAKITR